MRHDGLPTHPDWWKGRKAPGERLGILAAHYRKGDDNCVANSLLWACSEYDLAERRLRVIRAEWERRKVMMREHYGNEYDEAIARVDEATQRMLGARGDILLLTPEL